MYESTGNQRIDETLGRLHDTLGYFHAYMDAHGNEMLSMIEERITSDFSLLEHLVGEVLSNETK